MLKGKKYNLKRLIKPSGPESTMAGMLTLADQKFNYQTRDITTDPIYIKRIIKKYYEQFYAHKFDNPDEMNKSLEHNLLKLTQEKTDDLNRLISVKDMESIITFQNRKHRIQMGSLVNSIKHLRKKSYQFSTISSRR